MQILLQKDLTNSAEEKKKRERERGREGQADRQTESRSIKCYRQAHVEHPTTARIVSWKDPVSVPTNTSG